MDANDILTALNLWAEQIDHKPDDLHEVHFRVQEMISELRATGMAVPEDLLEFERELTARVEGYGGESAGGGNGSSGGN